MEIPKEERIRLTPTGYRKICALVRKRADGIDGLQCELCTHNRHNTIFDCHHIRFRSDYGSDTLENLIFLCRDCHNEAHGVNEKQVKRELMKKMNEGYIKFFNDMYRTEAEEIYKKYRR